MRNHLLMWAAWAVVLAPPLSAQARVEVGPVFGSYRPLGQFDPTSVYAASLPGNPRDLSGDSWGAAAQLSFRGRLGAAAQFSVARSTLSEVNTPAGPLGPTDAQVLVLSAQAQYDVSPEPRRYRVWLGAGPALVGHGGTAYARYGSPTSLGGAVGVSVAAPLGAHVSVTAGATALRYVLDVAMPPALRANPGSLQHGVQTDALLHLGLRMGWP